MDLITSLGEAAGASGCKQQKQVVQLQLKGTHWKNMVWLPDSTEKLRLLKGQVLWGSRQ